LLARLFVDVRATKNRELFNMGRQWNRTTNRSARTLCRINDFSGAGVQYTEIEGFKPDANILTLHFNAFVAAVKINVTEDHTSVT